MKRDEIRASRITERPIRLHKPDSETDAEVLIRTIIVFLVFTAAALILIGAHE